MSTKRDDENNYICQNDTNSSVVSGHHYDSTNGTKSNEITTDFTSSSSNSKSLVTNSVPIKDQYTSVSNCLRSENTNSDSDTQSNKVNSIEKSRIQKVSGSNNVSFSDDEVTTATVDVCVATSQQSMIPLIKNTMRISKMTKDTDTLCGFSATCPTPQVQSMATKKIFLLFFCIALVLQGMFYTYFVSVLTTIEKLFQIRSQTTGIIMSASEAGQIIGGLVLPYYGGRGNRPKWIAGGVVTFSIGILLSATPQLYLNANDLTSSYTITNNSKDFNIANTCSYTDHINFQNTSDSLEIPVCVGEDSSSVTILLIFFFSLLAVGIGHTTVQNLGFPYLDDNVKAEESPSYFGITIGVRIFGPTLGFIFGSFCMRFYIYPLQNVEFEPTDPRWIGAWWMGIIFISIALFFISIVIALFPKRLPSQDCKKYCTIKGTTEHETNQKNGSYYNPSSTMIIHCQKEYTYIEPEENKGNVTPISNVQNPKYKMGDSCTKDWFNCSSCCSVFTKLSLCLPLTLLKSKDTTELKAERSQEPRGKSEFWSSISRLLKNKVLLLRAASSVLHLLPIAGLYTFLPKYLETQFNVTVHSAAMISGVGGILVMGVGIASSGYVIRKLRLSPTKVASWIAFTALLYSIGMFILMFVGCPKESYGIYDNNRHTHTLCETSCQNCDRSIFAPICASNGRSYFSACHSGCSIVTSQNISNELMFSNCDCLPPGVNATLGKCDSGCQNIVFYISVFCIFVFIHSTSEVGAMMLTLRCVDPADKAMALGLISAAVGLFGNVPCPIIYGSVIDYSCIVWMSSCDGQGACQLYDTDEFRYFFHGTTGIIMFLAFIVDLFVVKYSKTVKFDHSSPNEIDRKQNNQL